MSLCGKFCKCGFKPDLFWFLLMGNIKKCAFDWFKWSDRFLISASKIVVLKHLLERLNMLQLRGSVHEGFVVTWCATLAVVGVSVNNFLNWWGCKREIRPLIHWVGRKEDFFFFYHPQWSPQFLQIQFVGVSHRVRGLLVRKSNLNIIYCICIEVRIQLIPETHQIQGFGPEHLELGILMPFWILESFKSKRGGMDFGW